MSIKVRVLIKNDSMQAIVDNLNSSEVQKDVGAVAVDQMKDFISKGISPVRGERRFPAYKNPAKYPAKKKPARPVNLNLTGDMLDALVYKITGRSLTIGIFDAHEADKAQTHQDGLNGVPQRRLIPDEDGEEFAVSIMRAIGNVYNYYIRDIIKRTSAK